MTDTKRVLYLISIMAAITFLVMAITISILYRTALEGQKERMFVTIQSQARLMEVIARHEKMKNDSSEVWKVAILNLITEAHKRYKTFGETGEFVVVRRDGNQIHFVLYHDGETLAKLDPVPFDSNLAEPARMALSGKSGTLIGLDYRGSKVLAAYEPVRLLNLGLVAKIDLVEIRMPFIRAGAISFTIAVLLVVIATILFRKGINPLIRRLQDHTRQLEAEHEKIRHLNEVLKAIRKVNQLIVKEKDLDRLIQVSCQLLTSTRGYESTWIALQDETGTFRKMAENGLGEAFSSIAVGLKQGQLPQCAKRALSIQGVQVIDDISSICTDCPLSSVYAEQGAFAVRLECKGQVYGVLVVCVSRSFVSSMDEQGLFRELADDIAFAIHSIKIEESHRESVQTLLEHEGRFEIMFESAPDAYYLHDFQGRFIDGNKAAEDMIGYRKEELMGKSFLELEILTPADLQRAATQLQKNVHGQPTGPDEFILNRKDGKQVFAEMRALPVKIMGQNMVLGIARDISERKSLEDQLRQSLKLEAIGRLSGGIAHDFNNLLTAIIGNAEMALIDLGKEAPLREIFEEIKEAGERAASLTHQLLACSRTQILQPTVMNINDTVRDLDNMLRRIIGEDIQLRTTFAPNLGQVETDITEMEQVIMNLVVNARDAMPQGGKLTIETANKELGEDYARGHVAVKPGSYIMLAVSDTGMGMTKEAQARLFEPFFTTKEKGTGFGLSTTYGIVKQSGGNIWVYSEPGKGTTFKIYLPRVEEEAPGQRKTEIKKETLDGSETVLLVEDDEMVRNTALKILNRYGYTVLCASDVQDALRICHEHDGPIDLMLTDVIMPGISGKELAEQAQAVRPDLKVLFMSGYTDDAIVHHGVLEEGIAFLQKPFTPEALARKVREVLGK